MSHSILSGTKAPPERPRVGHEKKSDGFRVGHEKKSDGLRVGHNFKSDVLRVGIYFQSDVLQGYTPGKHHFYIAVEHVCRNILSVSEHFRRYLI